MEEFNTRSISEKKFKKSFANFEKLVKTAIDSSDIYTAISNNENAFFANVVGEITGFQSAINRILPSIDWTKPEGVYHLWYKVEHMTQILSGFKKNGIPNLVTVSKK